MPKIEPIEKRVSDKIQDPPEEARVVELPSHYLRPDTSTSTKTVVSLPGRSALVIDQDGVVHVKNSSDNPNLDPDSLSSGQLDSSTDINVGDSTLTISGSNKYIAVGSDPSNQGWILSEDGMAGYASGSERFRFFLTSSGSFGVGDVLIGDPSGHYIWWDQSEGKLIVSGEVDATTGQIGGWNIGADSLYDDYSKIILSSGSVPYIQITGAGNISDASGLILTYNSNNWKFWTSGGTIYFSYDGGSGYSNILTLGTTLLKLAVDIGFGEVPDNVSLGNDGSGNLSISVGANTTSFYPTGDIYLGKDGKPWGRLYLGDTAGDGIYFGGTKRIYQSSTDIISILATIDVSDNVSCTNLQIGGGNNTIYGDGTHVEFNGLSNAHLVPEAGLINSAQIGTATNYWYSVHYGSGGLVSHSTPLCGENKDIFQLFKKIKNVKDDSKIDKNTIDPEFKEGDGVRMDKLVMGTIVAIRKIDDRLKKIEEKLKLSS